MFVPLSNIPRPYAWGSRGGISALLGGTHTDALEAELWFGAHPSSPSRIGEVELTSGARTLDEWIRIDTHSALGNLTQLPFLLKVLAAESPLSLQVHPTREYATEQFDREEAAGIPRDATNRNYRDRNHKPELILALEDGFTALCGIRPADERERIIAELGLSDVIDAGDVAGAFRSLLSGRDTEAVAYVVERTLTAARHANESEFAEAYLWVVRLGRAYPGDPGVVLSLFLNLVKLRAGEALYLPAGNLHAYLQGIGIEVMASSDNVLRGGLTSKHIDVPELLAVADMSPLPVPRVTPTHVDGALRYAGEAREFELLVVRDQANIVLSGPAIALNLGGRASLRGAHTVDELKRGEARFVTLDEGTLEVLGDHVVIAQPQGTWREE